MTRASLPCLWLALAAAPLSAADFPLEDYVPADFHRHYLSLSPSIGWWAASQESDSYEPGVEREDGNRSAGLALAYGSVRNSRTLRWDVSTGGRANVHGSDGAGRRTDPGIPDDRSRFDESDEYQSLNFGAFSRMSGKWHFRERLFLQAAGDADFDWLPLSERTGSGWRLLPLSSSGDSAVFASFDNGSDNRARSFRMTARLGGGYGRLEEVTFAETGMHLLDRIADVTGRRMRLGKEGMRELEAFVEARRKRRPFFDARRAAIHDLESVTLFLAERGLDSLPPRAVLEMADEWRHAGRVRRFTGWELRVFPFLHVDWQDHRWEQAVEENRLRVHLDSVGNPASLRPSAPVAGATTTYESENRSWRSQTRYGAGLEAAWRRPWRRFWQFDVDAWARYGLERQESALHIRRDTGGVAAQRSDSYAGFSYPRLESGASASATWLPTSRTLIRASLEGRWNRKFDYLDPAEAAWLFEGAGGEVEQDVMEWNLSAGLDARYYLADRLLLWADFTAGMVRRDAHDEGEAGRNEYSRVMPRHLESSNARASLSAGITYYLF